MPEQPAKEETVVEEAEEIKEKDVAIEEIMPKKQTTPCDLTTSPRQFSNTPYYTSTLIDNHFHMPSIGQAPTTYPESPVLDKDITPRDVVCLFNKEKVKNAFGFYGIDAPLKDKALQSIREIEQQYPGIVIPFFVLESPDIPVNPPQVEEIINSNQDLFKGYGEAALYLPHYSGVKPNNPAMRELYAVADKHNLIVMMHFKESQEQQAVEEMLRDYPNVQFLFHGMERLPWVDTFFNTLLDKYPNAHYSVDMNLFGEDSYGRPLFYAFKGKQDFITQFKQKWQGTLDKKVAYWKSKIEKHPDQFLWGTDRGAFLWHYDPEVEALLEEYSRAFIGQLDPAVQEKYAYKNAENLLQER